jgi:hypothetical protein
MDSLCLFVDFAEQHVGCLLQRGFGLLATLKVIFCRVQVHVDVLYHVSEEDNGVALSRFAKAHSSESALNVVGRVIA